MPRKLNPGDIKVGKGLAPEGTVEDNSHRYPERDVDPLRVHVHDPSRAHMASSIGIVDAANCFISDEVEGALQELCSGAASAGRLNGLIAGGTFVEPIPTVGVLILTLVPNTFIMDGGMLFNASGLPITLPDVAQDCFVYFDEDSTSGTYQTLQFSVGTPPEVETTAGVENVMIAKITCDGAGNISAYQDARFFVRNLDRKVEYSSRGGGETVDTWSEGCFATLNAAMFWMQWYGPTTSSEEQKGTILIRGHHTISDTLTVPTDYVTFQGDGDAALILSANSGRPLIDISGRSGIHFKDLAFVSQTPNNATLVGVLANTTAVSDIVFEQCRFSATALGQQWTRAISLDTNGAAQCDRIRVINCHIRDAETGILIDSSSGGLISGCQITAGFGAATSVIGVSFSQNAGFSVENNSVVETVIEDFVTGISCEQATKFKVEGCFITDAANGISIGTSTSSYANISNTYVQLEDNTGLNGISFLGSYHTVDNCDIWNQRATGAYGVGVIPVGVSFNGVHCKVQNTQVRNFLNTQDASNAVGHAVGWDGSASHGLVSDCILQDSGIDLPHGASAMVITGNKITGVGVPGVTQPALINVGKAAAGVSITGNLCDCLETAPFGVRFLGGDDLYGHNILIDSNIIVAPNGASSAGIQIVNRYRDWTISNNKVDGYLAKAPTDPVAAGIAVNGTSNMLPNGGSISNNSVTRCMMGILLQGANANPVTGNLADIQVTDNHISYCCRTIPSYPILDTFLAQGCMGIGIDFCRDLSVSGNQLENMGVIVNAAGTVSLPTGEEQTSGIYVRNSTSVAIQNNKIGPVYANAIVVGHILTARPIRVDCRSADVGAGNTFTMDLISIDGNSIAGGGSAPPHGDAATDCGIKVVVARGTDLLTSIYQIQGLSISGNHVANVTNSVSIAADPTAGISFRQLHLGESRDIQIENNTVRGIVGLGIQVWASGTNSADAKIMSFGVSSNTLEDITHATDSVAGIQIVSNHASIVSGATVANNSLATMRDAGILMRCGNAASGGVVASLQHFLVEGNRINAVNVGVSTDSIGILSEADGPDATLMNIGIQSNSIGNLKGGASLTTAIQIDHDETDMEGYHIVDNSLFALTHGVRLQGGQPGVSIPALPSVRRMSVSSNSITVFDNALPHYGIFAQTEAFEWSNCSLNDNGITMLGTPGTQPGIFGQIVYTLDNAADKTHSQISVDGNTVNLQTNTGSGITMSFLGNASVENFSMDGNNANATVLGTLSNLGVPVGDIGAVRSWSQSNNQVIGAILGVQLQMNSIANTSCDVRGIRVSNNVVDSLGAVPSQAIGLSFAGSVVYNVFNVGVDGNQISNATIPVNIDFLAPNIKGLSVSNNLINEWGGLDNTAISVSAGATARGVSVTNNQITDGDITKASNAIHYANVGQAITHGLTIANNDVNRCGGSGALVELGAATNASSTINPSDRAIAVRDNTFTQCALFNNAAVAAVVLIKPDATNADPGAIVGFTVSGNTLNLCGPAGPAYIPWVWVDVNAYNISYLGDVSGNSLVGDTTDVGSDTHWPKFGISLNLPETIAADGGYALTVNDNTVHRFASVGIRCVFDGRTRGVQISGNHTVRLPNDDLAGLPTHIYVGVNQNSLLGLSVENNVCDGDARFGIDVRMTGTNAGIDVFPWQGINVSNNILRRIKSADGVGINIQGKDARIEGLTVDSNNLAGPGYAGIVVENNQTPLLCVNANLEAVSISGNTISMVSNWLVGPNVPAHTGIYFAWGAGRNPEIDGVQISNNNIYYPDPNSADAGSVALQVVMFGTTPSAGIGFARGFNICGNILRNAKQNQLLLSASEADFIVNGWVIEGNNIHGNSTVGGAYQADFAVYMNDTIPTCFMIANNVVRVDGNGTVSRIGLEIKFNAGVGTADHWSIHDNQITGYDSDRASVVSPNVATTFNSTGTCKDNYTQNNSGGSGFLNGVAFGAMAGHAGNINV